MDAILNMTEGVNVDGTKMLSGLMSAWRMLHRLSSLRAKKSCWLYDRTALMWSPTSLPYFFSTSRKFMLHKTQVVNNWGEMNAVVQEEKRKSWCSVPQRLENKTKMLLMIEMPEKAKAVEFVVGISIVQLPEELQLFQTGFLPVYQKHACYRCTMKFKEHIYTSYF